MTNKILDELSQRFYLLVPMACIVFWALISLLKDNFNILPAADFPAIYYAARYIFTNPELVYTDAVHPLYPYTPCIATIFVPLALLPFEIAHWIYLFILLILAEFLIIIFDKILQLKNIVNKKHRFLFLLAISNGLRYVQLFDYLTAKMFTAFFLLLFLKREIKFRELNKDINNLKFKFTQIMILIFAIGLSPQFAFLIPLYLLATFLQV